MKMIYKELLKSLKGKIRPITAPVKTPSVTVVVPCYNYGHYLEGCVNSLRDQEGIDLEIIIVNDCSPDDTRAIAERLVSQDPRIKYVHHDERMGHIATYNDGLDRATGEFVLLLSADDLVAKNSLSRAAAFLTANPTVGLVYGRVVDFSGEAPPVRDEGQSWIVWSGLDWLEHRCRNGFNVVAGPSAVMRTSVLRSFGGYRSDLPHAGDFEMWIRTAAVSDIGYIMGVDQAFYRHHGMNMNRKDYKAGTVNGQLIDLKQRWQSFEAVFSGVGSKLKDQNRLLKMARSTLVGQALNHVNHAYARGFRDFPAADFEALAQEIDKDASQSPAGRTLARRKAFGMVSLPLHPLWAPATISERLSRKAFEWRYKRIGV